MIEFVTMAEDFVAKNGNANTKRATIPARVAAARNEIAPMLRGAIARCATAAGSTG